MSKLFTTFAGGKEYCVIMTKKTEIITRSESVVSQDSLTQIESLIHTIRDRQVMLDQDLAALYGVETRRLNEQVRRNIERFPQDFMFQLSPTEFRDMRSQAATATDTDNQTITGMSSQFATTLSRRRPLTALPYAFTENGVAMLSSVLRSPTAIEVNIRIMRAFTAMRQFITSNMPVFQRLEAIEHHQLRLAAHQDVTDKRLEEVFRRLDERIIQPTQGIFFDGQIFDAYTFVCDLVRQAKTRIVLIDNYVNDSVLSMLDKRSKGVKATIYSKTIPHQLGLDLEKHNAQYEPIEVLKFDKAHDRFLCIDETVYHLGASMKDLGKKWFAFSRMEWTATELLEKM